MQNPIGRIHSVDSLGTVDGPGIRYIVFLQGCKMRCYYCHNPDSWPLHKGYEQDADSLFAQVIKSQKYMKTSNGGLTISGGEPLLQAEFVAAMFERAKAANMHTCLDTNGFISKDAPILDKLLALTDLVMLDIKHIDAKKHKELTAQQIDLPQSFAKRLQKEGIRTWFRQVLLNDWTMGLDYAKALATYAKQFDNVELIELLPFHQLGKYKWEEAGIPYKLGDAERPQKKAILEMQAYLEQQGLKTRL